MPIAVFFNYVTWLYSAGIKEYLIAWANFHWFLFHFFSIGILLRTLFVPWHRMREKGGRGLDIEGMLSRLAVNTILRVVGFVVRAALLAVGLISEIFLFAVAAPIFFVFILSPAAVPFLIISGLMLLAI